MTSWYFVRHGEPDWPDMDARGLEGAVRDLVPLTERGVRQAGRAAADLAALGAVRVVSSPSTRALQTAAIIALQCGTTPIVRFDLREWVPDLSYRWTASTVERAAASYREAGGGWPRGGARSWESADALRARAVRALLLDPPVELPTVVVTHEMVIEALTGRSRVGFCEVVPADALPPVAGPSPSGQTGQPFAPW